VTTSLSRSQSAPLVSGSFEIHHAAFADVLGNAPRLERVIALDAHEGPVYVRDDDALYVTSLPIPAPDSHETGPRVAIRRIALDGDRFPVDRDSVTTLVTRSNVANGMTLDADGRLVVCEQGARSAAASISLIDRESGSREVLVDNWRGLPLNSPNDVVVGRDGAVWFTDPSYGHLQGFRPEPRSGDYLYRFDPAAGQLDVVADEFDKPNGIVLSPDESVLYVTDSGANHEIGTYDPRRPHHIVAYDVGSGGHLTGRRLVAVTTPGFPDGITVDAAGRLYASAASGVQIFTPQGRLIGEIRLPGAVNVTFGGPDRNILFITADTAIWAAVLNAQGV
jgi:gluconolactonase